MAGAWLVRVALPLVLWCCAATWAAGGAEPSPSLEAAAPVVCYVGTWAAYRPAGGQFEARHVEPSLCTHLVYAFAGLSPANWSLVPLDRWNDLEEGGGRGSFAKFTELRRRRPGLKVTLAVGGWNEGSRNYSDMAADPLKRKLFVESAARVVREHGFDGLDLDWEYPTQREGRPEDKTNFVRLASELRAALPPPLLLTAAVGAAPDVLRAAYDLPALARHLDLLHLMAYDYHGAWEPQAGPNAPLAGRDVSDPLSVEKSVQQLLAAGAPPEKVVLGLPCYGRTFVAQDPAAHPGLGTPTQPQGFAGPYTGEKGFMGFNEICNELQQNQSQWHQHWDDVSSTPYAVRGNQLIAFDDMRSIDMKVRYALKQGLAGVMVWSMDTDDFTGACSASTGQDNYPLLRTINKAMVEGLEERRNEIISHQEKARDAHKHQGAGGAVGVNGAASYVLAALAFLRVVAAL